MKRSEMIDMIQEVVLEIVQPKMYFEAGEPVPSVQDVENNYNLAEYYAEIILFKMENAGMLPPLNEQNIHPEDTDDRKYENAVIKYFHSWEPEDEKK